MTSYDNLSSAKRKLLEERLRQKGIKTPVRAPIPPRKERGPCPLSFAQQRLWFLDQWAKESAWYNVPMALRFSGSLHLEALERCLATVVQRHEILRTTFEERAGESVQIITPYPYGTCRVESGTSPNPTSARHLDKRDPLP